MLPPLIGDSQGRYKVHIVGNSGSGKESSAALTIANFAAYLYRYWIQTTLGKNLAQILNVPYISLDTLCWKPGWVKSTREEMQDKLQKAMAEAENGWVIDGNWVKGLAHLLVAECGHLGLDPPLILYFPRIVIRTFLVMLRLREPCSPGCFETPQSVFASKESILWLSLSNHWHVRRREQARFFRIGIGMGSEASSQKMRRLGGWGSQLRGWLREVKAMIECK
ncbi:hypothetical protein B0H13DRAFT_1746210 [Mycena leptocephala]|nr:hypothetical protein B0H13DRAFT_1746210 [Mycena leptocephala]